MSRASPPSPLACSSLTSNSSAKRALECPSPPFSESSVKVSRSSPPPACAEKPLPTTDKVSPTPPQTQMPPSSASPPVPKASPLPSSPSSASHSSASPLPRSRSAPAAPSLRRCNAFSRSDFMRVTWNNRELSGIARRHMNASERARMREECAVRREEEIEQVRQPTLLKDPPQLGTEPTTRRKPRPRPSVRFTLPPESRKPADEVARANDQPETRIRSPTQVLIAPKAPPRSASVGTLSVPSSSTQSLVRERGTFDSALQVLPRGNSYPPRLGSANVHVIMEQKRLREVEEWRLCKLSGGLDYAGESDESSESEDDETDEDDEEMEDWIEIKPGEQIRNLFQQEPRRRRGTTNVRNGFRVVHSNNIVIPSTSDANIDELTNLNFLRGMSSSTERLAPQQHQRQQQQQPPAIVASATTRAAEVELMSVPRPLQNEI